MVAVFEIDLLDLYFYTFSNGHQVRMRFFSFPAEIPISYHAHCFKGITCLIVLLCLNYGTEEGTGSSLIVIGKVGRDLVGITSRGHFFFFL